MEGEAKEFVKKQESIMPFYSWKQMKEELLLSFGSDDNPDIILVRIEKERRLKEFMDSIKLHHSVSMETETNDSGATKQSEETVAGEVMQKSGEDHEEMKKLRGIRIT